MNVIFDLGHPAHFHLFKNFIHWLKENGHNIRIGIQDKDILSALLDHEGLEYRILSRRLKKRGKFQLFLQWQKHKNALRDLTRDFKPDLLVGTSVAINWVGCKYNAKSWNFNEDDSEVIRDYWLLASPFVTYKIKPSCLSSENRKRDIYHPSYHELAYLHPNNFTPDMDILKKYDLKEKEYIIARFSALQAHHDAKARGISKELWEKIEKIIGRFKVVKSIENQKTHQIEPWDMHHVMVFSKMIISDSQTMTIEGSVLGVPAVRINTFIDKSKVITELEEKYKLAFGILPNEEKLALNTIEMLIKSPDTDSIWVKKREIVLSEKVDLNRWMIDFFKNKFN